MQPTHTSSLALLTDLYELTMAYGYWKRGRHDRGAVFNLFYRTNPFNGGYCIACGLEMVIDFIASFRFDESDIDYLAALTTGDGSPLFSGDFLAYLADLRLSVDVNAVPEGTAVFPREPLLRVSGPLLQCQILETALLNIINFQTLIATKASRIVTAAEGDPVLEFGLRRAQGINGGLAASRAAFIGGCTATSNALAGKLFGIPVKGTHAHSWVMSFGSEQEAFDAYAEIMPDNCIFLVDTYDSVEGVKNAVRAGLRLRARGYEMTGVRLDSGNLEELSGTARAILDGHGFEHAAIVASNDLDEYSIRELKKNGAPINLWGVGTRLVTAHDEPALGGVYKLAAMMDDDGGREYRVKVSDDEAKATIPGILQIRRYHDDSGLICDVIYDEELGVECGVVDIETGNIVDSPTDDIGSEDLLVPVFAGGSRVYDVPAIDGCRKRAAEQLGRIPAAVKRIDTPEQYPVRLDRRLALRRKDIVGGHCER